MLILRQKVAISPCTIIQQRSSYSSVDTVRLRTNGVVDTRSVQCLATALDESPDWTHLAVSRTHLVQAEIWR
jgi:hypothetical protein